MPPNLSTKSLAAKSNVQRVHILRGPRKLFGVGCANYSGRLRKLWKGPRRKLHPLSCTSPARQSASPARGEYWLMSLNQQPRSPTVVVRFCSTQLASWLNEAEMKKLTGWDAARVLQLSLVDGTRLTRHGVSASDPFGKPAWPAAPRRREPVTAWRRPQL